MSLPSAERILECINSRLVVLGNKTHSDKRTSDEKLRAAHGIRELVTLRKWIENGGKRHRREDHND